MNLNKNYALLFIHPDYPYMAATPDGEVGEDVVVEVRCPFTGRNEMIEPGSVFPFLKYQTSDTALKRSSSMPYVSCFIMCMLY